MVHTNFNAAFTDGHVFESRNGKITVFSLEVAKLNLPSGNIIACDPGLLYTLEAKPFSRTVSPASYPVWLCFAEDYWGTVSACAMLKFSESAPVRWEPATCVGEDISTLAPGEAFAYGVDSGLGCFVDAQAIQGSAEELERMYFVKLVPALGDESFCEVVLTPPESANSKLVLNQADKSFWHIIVTPLSDTDLVAFRTGFGDGRYASYWGFDEENNLACLVTDFRVLLESIEGEIVVDRVFEKLGTTLQHPELDGTGLVVHLHSPDTFDWKQVFGELVVDDVFHEVLDEAECQRQLAQPRLVVEAIGRGWGEAFLLVGLEQIYYTRGAYTDTQHYHLFQHDEEFPENTKLVLQFVKGVRVL
jgi:hypothetical protein